MVMRMKVGYNLLGDFPLVGCNCMSDLFHNLKLLLR